MARILVADDDPGFQDMLQHLLEQDGHEVVIASNGVEALKIYRAQPTDLVITDIVMPDKEGIETIIELREDFPDAKIIVMSGGGGIGLDDYLENALLFGARRAIPKPFDMHDMMNAVNEVLAEGTGK